MRPNPIRCARFSAIVLLAGTCVPAVGQSDKLMDLYATTLTANTASGSVAVQGTRPLPQQRGVNLDGTMRSPSLQGWMLAGNPYGEAWNANAQFGDVRLDIGAYMPTEVDIALPAQVPWMIGRSYNGVQLTSGSAHQDSNGYQGKNWSQMSQPEMLFVAGLTADLDVVYIVYGADRYLEFQRTGVSAKEFKGKNGTAGVVQNSTGSPDTYVYFDQRGMKTTFFGGNTSSHRADWQVWKIEDPAGNVAYVGDPTTASTAVSSGYNSNGSMAVAFDSAGRRFTYTYTTLDSVSRLTQVKAEVNTGSWVMVGQVDYGYYQTGGTTYGDIGNLKTVTLTVPMTDQTQTKKKLYRYWTGTYNGSTNPGYPNTIQYVVDYEGYRAADWAGDSTFDDDPLTMSESNLKPYAKAYLTYDSSYRVATAYFDGECGCSGGNNGTYSLSYGTNGSYTNVSGYDTVGSSPALGQWATKTTVTRPDSATVTQYFDEVGQPLSRVLAAGGSVWPTDVERDANGVILRISAPSNTTGYSSDTISLASSAGNYQPVVMVSGGTNLDGLPQQREIAAGTGGSAYLRSTTEYTSASLTVGGSNVVRPLAQYTWGYTQDTATASAHGSPQTGSYETQRAYTMWTGAAALMPKQITTTYPAVSTGNNGSNSATSEDRYLRKDGTVTFTDAGLRPGYSGGWGKLSGLASRIGYAGYQAAPELAGTKWHVRNRMLDSVLGRWTRRDPAGDVDGPDLYEYAVDQPVGRQDPEGLAVGIACRRIISTNTAGFSAIMRIRGIPTPSCFAFLELIKTLIISPIFWSCNERVTRLNTISCPLGRTCRIIDPGYSEQSYDCMNLTGGTITCPDGSSTMSWSTIVVTITVQYQDGLCVPTQLATSSTN